MADILIRGMDKPGSCHECDFCEVQDINFETLYFCNRNDRFLDDEEACNIPSDCPLYELPPHGDLIDRDYIQRTLKPYSKEDEQVEVTLGTAKRLIQNAINAPVIVPADKEVQDALP